MEKQKEKYRQFRKWQRQPHQVAPLSEEQRDCPTCGTHYTGNYCPRCGQSARIGRYSFRNALLLFLDVWGLGNRGMFRSLRDLVLRPGYMIRDYLRGMQMAYFPPFKMFFLLITLSILVDSGMNIQGVNRSRQQQEEFIYLAWKWYNGHITMVWLTALLLFTMPLYLMFRHCPAMPDLRFSECFVSMVYIINMYIIYGIIPSLLCFSHGAEEVFSLLVLAMAVIPLRQLSGYSYWSTVWRVLAAIVIFNAVSLLLLVAGGFTASYIYIHVLE